MSRFWQHFISNGSGDLPVPGPEPTPPPSEGEALDAFSRVVVYVAETLRPAVVNLRGERGRSGGSRPRLLLAPAGFLLTNHPLVQGPRPLPGRLRGRRA